jgi:hypothetical protein
MIRSSCSPSRRHGERGFGFRYISLEALRISDRSVWKKTDSTPTFSMVRIVGLRDTVTGNRRKGLFAGTWRADYENDDGERKGKIGKVPAANQIGGR